MSNAKKWFQRNTPEGRIIHGDPKSPAYAGVAPKDLVFSELNANNTQILDEYGNVRERYQQGFDSLLPQFQTELDKINLNTGALEKLRERALSPGESPWLAMQKANLQNKLGDMRDSAVSQQGAANANMLSSLAMAGGLSGGAAERANRQSNSDFNKARQQISRYGVTEGNNLAIADEQQKQQLLGQLQGLEIQALQPQIMKSQAMLGQMSNEQGLGMNANAFNINTALNELAQKRAFDMEQYKAKMEQYAADRTAHAQENAGGGGKGGGK
jgi:hypothetical protein